MRTIPKALLLTEIERIILEAATDLDVDVVSCLKRQKDFETLPIAKSILSEIIENQDIARQEKIPMCQDTGVAVFFIEVGNELYFDYNLEQAINEAVHNGYVNGYLRKSVVDHPLTRKNTQDNTPAILHFSWVMGNQLRIRFASKGAGSENMSRLKMLTPSDGIQGIVDFVVETVQLAGGKACPPIILGIGLGGDFEKSALLAKEALFRKLDDTAKNLVDADLESLLFKTVNDLNIGPMGLKGKTTCLAVKVNSYPCHIASLPIAVNIQCHASRHKEIVL